MFVYDVDGDLVNLHDKDIEVAESVQLDYESMVVVTNSYEIVNNINPFVLHYGTEEECKEFIKQLGHSLNVLKVKGICSTQTDRVDIETNYTKGRLQTDCDCDYCRCNCS